MKDKISKYTGKKSSYNLKLENIELKGNITMLEEEHPFYGIHIISRKEEKYINNILKKYRNEAVTEELKGKIWEELQMERYLGHLTIPFKVVMRRDAEKKFPDYIEIILDTKL